MYDCDFNQQLATNMVLKNATKPRDVSVCTGVWVWVCGCGWMCMSLCYIQISLPLSFSPPPLSTSLSLYVCLTLFLFLILSLSLLNYQSTYTAINLHIRRLIVRSARRTINLHSTRRTINLRRLYTVYEVHVQLSIYIYIDCKQSTNPNDVTSNTFLSQDTHFQKLSSTACADVKGRSVVHIYIYVYICIYL